MLGYPFDRYEGDHEGNLAELRRLLAALELKLGPVLFSGRPWAEIQQAWRARHLVVLPWAHPVRKKLARVLRRRDPLSTGLPMGLRGTARWLRRGSRR